MKIRKHGVLLACALFTATPALAQQHEIVLEPPRYSTQYVSAEVTRVSPVFEYLKRSKAARECWDEPVGSVQHYYRSPAGETLVGGIIGGTIGHQLGDGRGRDLATVLGTVVGARMGHDAAYAGYDSQPQYRRVCAVVEQDNGFEVIQDGYQISYRYAGKDYHARLPYDPGERIKLKVQVKQPPG